VFRIAAIGNVFLPINSAKYEESPMPKISNKGKIKIEIIQIAKKVNMMFLRDGFKFLNIGIITSIIAEL
jgi:hypothetical protein